MDQIIPGSAEQALSAIIPKMTRDMRFVGWFYIIYGALTSLTIIGAIIGVPLLISGLRLREAADDFDGYHRTNNFDAVLRGLERQGRFFFIQKVFAILTIVFLLLYIILIAMLVATGLFFGVEDRGIAV
jgi:hypothetical protein